METRVIVCGGCHYNDYKVFKNQLDQVLAEYENVTLVSGHAKGVDTMAERILVVLKQMIYGVNKYNLLDYSV